MKKLTKILLTLTIAGFASGLLFATGVFKAGNAVGWYMLLPGGAICFGAFMICYMLEKEFTLFDAEQQSHPTSASEAGATPGREADDHSQLSARPAH